MASGVPVVQPRRGAATEIVETTGGGLLTTPGDHGRAGRRPPSPACSNPAERRDAWRTRGYDGVRAHYAPAQMRDRARRGLQRRASAPRPDAHRRADVLEVAGVSKQYATPSGPLDVLSGHRPSRSRPATASRSSVRRAAARARCCTSSARSSRRASGTVRLDGVEPVRPRRSPPRRVPQPAGRLRVPGPPPAAAVQRARERAGADARRRRDEADGAAVRAARSTCSTQVGLSHGCTTARRSCPAARSSAWRWRARWSSSPGSCCATSRRAISISDATDAVADLLLDLHRRLSGRSSSSSPTTSNWRSASRPRYRLGDARLHAAVTRLLLRNLALLLADQPRRRRRRGDGGGRAVGRADGRRVRARRACATWPRSGSGATDVVVVVRPLLPRSTGRDARTRSAGATAIYRRARDPAPGRAVARGAARAGAHARRPRLRRRRSVLAVSRPRSARARIGRTALVGAPLAAALGIAPGRCAAAPHRHGRRHPARVALRPPRDVGPHDPADVRRRRCPRSARRVRAAARRRATSWRSSCRWRGCSATWPAAPRQHGARRRRPAHDTDRRARPARRSASALHARRTSGVTVRPTPRRPRRRRRERAPPARRAARPTRRSRRPRDAGDAGVRRASATWRTRFAPTVARFPTRSSPPPISAGTR